MTSFILCALFVYGISKVIDGYADFFDIDLDRFYNESGALFKDQDSPVQITKIRPKWQKFLFKPLFYCNVCMSSVWGSVFYLVVYWNEIDFFTWACHLIISAAIISIINSLTHD